MHIQNKGLWLLTAAILLSGCTPMKAYRNNTLACGSPESSKRLDCPIEHVATHDGANYRIGFVEFDDQGHLFDRQQMHTVLSEIESQSTKSDLLLVIFAHGWKHNARGVPEDGNITTFKSVLSHLADAEQQIAAVGGSPARAVIGIYLGWRGASVPVPVFKEATFWTRKAAAHRVGERGAAEVLMRLERIRENRAAQVAANKLVTREDVDRTKLIAVGHSFGGAILYSALAHALEERFIHSSSADKHSSIRGFADLTVLVNPAFEAIRFSTLSDMAFERPLYPADQLPRLAVLTSEADWATRYAFPLARRFSTILNRERDYVRSNGLGASQAIDESGANLHTVGHFKPYRTHNLAPIKDASLERMSDGQLLLATQQFKLDWELGEDTLRFGELSMSAEPYAVDRAPYIVARVDGKLIADHNDLSNQAMLDFIKGLILMDAIKPSDLQLYSNFLLTR